MPHVFPKSPKPGQGRHRGGNGGMGGNHQKGDCCFAGQAVKAVWLGKFKLAKRFAILDVKTRMGLI